MGRLPRLGGSVQELEARVKEYQPLWKDKIGPNGFYAAMRIQLCFLSDPFEEWPLDGIVVINWPGKVEPSIYANR